MDKHLYTMMALWLQLRDKADEVDEHLTDRERGQGLVEYSFIIVFVSVACIVALGLLGTNISTLFSKVANCISVHTTVFFNDTATTEIYSLSLHDALPIYPQLP